jgi:catalase
LAGSGRRRSLRPSEENDDYTQASNLFRLMTKEQKERLFANTARAMAGVPQEIVLRWIGH